MKLPDKQLWDYVASFKKSFCIKVKKIIDIKFKVCKRFRKLKKLYKVFELHLLNGQKVGAGIAGYVVALTKPKESKDDTHFYLVKDPTAVVFEVRINLTHSRDKTRKSKDDAHFNVI